MLNFFGLLVISLLSLDVVLGVSWLPVDPVRKEPWWCPPGWTFYPGNKQCYKRVLIKVDQPIALEVCRQEAAELVSFHNKEENDFVLNNLVKLEERNWIGFQSTYKDNRVDTEAWTDGSATDFTEPANQQKETPKARVPSDDKKCYFYYKLDEKTGTWTAENCESKKIIDGFICKRSALNPKPPKEVCPNGTETTGETGLWTRPTPVIEPPNPPLPTSDPNPRGTSGPLTPPRPTDGPVTPPRPTDIIPGKPPKKIECDKGWIPYTDKKYGFVTKCFFFGKNFDLRERQNWKQWRDKCPGDYPGSTLATIANEDEEAAVVQAATQFSKTRIPEGKVTVWIGLERKNTTSTNLKEGWEWVDNTPVKYLNWMKDEPDHKIEQCARLLVDTDNNHKFWAEDCYERIWGLCQKSGYNWSG